MAVFGFGLGLVLQVLTVAVQNAVPYEELGTATSGVTFFRSIGGSFGTAVFGAIFANLLLRQRPAGAAPARGAPPGLSLSADNPDGHPPAARRRAGRCGRRDRPHHPDRCSSSASPSPSWPSCSAGPFPRCPCARPSATRNRPRTWVCPRPATRSTSSSASWSGPSAARTAASSTGCWPTRAGLDLHRGPCWLLYRVADRPDATVEEVGARLHVDPERLRRVSTNSRRRESSPAWSGPGPEPGGDRRRATSHRPAHHRPARLAERAARGLGARRAPRGGRDDPRAGPCAAWPTTTGCWPTRGRREHRGDDRYVKMISPPAAIS